MTTTNVTILKAKASDPTLLDHPEHCVLSRTAAADLRCSVGDQVAVTPGNALLAGEGAGLFTVQSIDDSVPTASIGLGQSGRAKLGDPAALVGTVAAVTWPPAALGMPDGVAEQTVGGAFVERVNDDGVSTTVLALAPHGGAIEPHTDVQAERVAAQLALFGASSWRCKGYRLGGGAGAWHVTATDLSVASFPSLATLWDRRFQYVVAFHGMSDLGIRIGGRAPAPLLQQIRTAIVRVITPNLPVTVASGNDALAGSAPANLCNRIAQNGEGIQIEQSLEARTDYGIVIASAVASVLKASLQR